MVKLIDEQISAVKPLFASQLEERMVRSCLQGCMGEVWADDRVHPTAAQFIIADFSYLGGDSSALGAADLVCNFGSAPRNYLVMVPPDEGWAELIKRHYPESHKKLVRYAIKDEGDIFDRERLCGFVAGLPEGYTLCKIDRELYELSAQFDWSSDLCRWYSDYEDYAQHGVGVAVLHGNELAAGASSYAWYNGGIEIEIDTKKEYRRQGLATVCASALILECLKTGRYPGWDAANLESVALSEKLGYSLDREYTAYLVNFPTPPMKTEAL